MNWSSKEFIWLDWTVLIFGILGVTWAVWRAVRKDKQAMQEAIWIMRLSFTKSK